MATQSKIEEIYREIHTHYTQYSRMQWTLYTAGYDFGLKEQYAKITDIMKNKANYETVLDYLQKDISPLEKRKAEIVLNGLKPFHLSAELNELDMEISDKVNTLSKILNTFRYQFEGREVSSVELNQVLSSESNREKRREAYFAKNQINKPMVEGGFIDLINLRKEYAKVYGAENFIAYKLEQDELDQNVFDGWARQLHDTLPQMNAAREKYAREFLNDERMLPWDEQYIDSRIAPSLNQHVDMSDFYGNIKELFDLFSIDISNFNITYDIFPRSNKSEWGYNFPVETAKDSRILANVKNKYHEYGVLLHETGHAVHSFLLNPDEEILNHGVSGIISEGIANLFQGFLYSPVFYKKFFKGEMGAGDEFKKLKEYRKQNSLRAINRIFFDHSLYKNDISSLDYIYDVYWKNQMNVLKEEPFCEEPPWAFTIHYTTHPIYLHNYFMGDVTCAMLSSVFELKAGVKMIDKPKEFGEFLINEVIKPSGRYPFGELFRRISGQDFKLDYML
ncbi:gluzincin family metallopeptidase [Cytobacillus oceanisediminis]|uniref:Peptidase M3-like protein n=1 Tax=Cytobacillus oceanisediminis TaxID=665099 RepID=A0A562JDM1_9BACI|nr:M3 family metallopeptidase [Cytobacillus oceanisediminis]TWH81262.1 peptidase M3-like protein [Cytobacillus oceanisediminis]